MFTKPPEYGAGKECCPFTMENLWFIRQNPYIIIFIKIPKYSLDYVKVVFMVLETVTEEI